MALPRIQVDKLPSSWVPNLEETVAQEETKQRRNKYGAIKTKYNGRTYDSKLEASVSRMLDTLRSATSPAERVLDVQYQVPYTLVDKRGKDRAIVYKADFVVIMGSGPHVRHYVLEAKGKATDVWNLKHRLFRERYPDLDLRVVKKPEDVVRIAQEGRPTKSLSTGRGA